MTRTRKSADRWEAEAFASQKQADRYREMAAALRTLDPDEGDELVNDEVDRLEGQAAELDQDAEYRWEEAHEALVTR